MNPFYSELQQFIDELGGLHNAHLHLDRAGTLAARYWVEADSDLQQLSTMALTRKHASIHTLHNGLAYTAADLSERVNFYLDEMQSVNTRCAETFVDVTHDPVQLSALQTLHAIKQQRAGQMQLLLGAYSPFGYRDDQPERWALLREALPLADFIGSLPEADDQAIHPPHIGFDEHCRRMLLLAQEFNLPLHVHVDQRFEASEDGTERLIRAIESVGAPSSANAEPMVWAVHVISPSCYDEARFQTLLAQLVKHNIGVISAPSAALGMRQLRPLSSPTGNSMARLLEMLAAGVWVRLGNDNIADICSPSTTANLLDEVFVLTAALRFYHPEILAHLACGQRLPERLRALVQTHLEDNQREIQHSLQRLGYNA